jgi:hypothetical protein
VSAPIEPIKIRKSETGGDDGDDDAGDNEDDGDDNYGGDNGKISGGNYCVARI